MDEREWNEARWIWRDTPGDSVIDVAFGRFSHDRVDTTAPIAYGIARYRDNMLMGVEFVPRRPRNHTVASWPQETVEAPADEPEPRKAAKFGTSPEIILAGAMVFDAVQTVMARTQDSRDLLFVLRHQKALTLDYETAIAQDLPDPPCVETEPGVWMAGDRRFQGHLIREFIYYGLAQFVLPERACKNWGVRLGPVGELWWESVISKGLRSGDRPSGDVLAAMAYFHGR